MPPAGPRRAPFAIAFILLVAGAVAVAWPYLRPVRPGAVVLISIDTLRADHLPVYGYTKGRTPALDALAKESVVFEHAYRHAPQTLPSHTSMLTGLLPFEHGVRDNLGFTLAATRPTIAGAVHQAGYGTGGFVSAYVLRPETGIGQGFESTTPTCRPRPPSCRWARCSGRAATLAAAERWLDSLGDDASSSSFTSTSRTSPTRRRRSSRAAAYDGEIAAADDIVGRLLDDFDGAGWYDDATIIMLSDHGEGLGDHGEDEHGLFVYDSTMRVPLMVKLPGAKNGGRRVPDRRSTSISRRRSRRWPASRRCHCAGGTFAQQWQGAALPPQGVYGEALYARYHFGWSELQSLTDERYKFIKAPRPSCTTSTAIRARRRTC